MKIRSYVGTVFSVPNPGEHRLTTRPLGGTEGDELAHTLKALASSVRLRLLVELLEGERTVDRLAMAVGVGQSATSHHLRLLRALRLVRVRRAGRHAYYSLHDHHIADLLAAVRHHHEHVHPSAPLQEPQARRAASASMREP